MSIEFLHYVVMETFKMLMYLTFVPTKGNIPTVRTFHVPARLRREVISTSYCILRERRAVP